MSHGEPGPSEQLTIEQVLRKIKKLNPTSNCKQLGPTVSHGEPVLSEQLTIEQVLQKLKKLNATSSVRLQAARAQEALPHILDLDEITLLWLTRMTMAKEFLSTLTFKRERAAQVVNARQNALSTTTLQIALEPPKSGQGAR